MKNQCEGCAYDCVTYCKVMCERPEPCWNYTSPTEAKKREREINDYGDCMRREEHEKEKV